MKQYKLFVSKIDGSKSELSGCTDYKNRSRKGKVHITKFKNNEKLLDLFRSNSGYYVEDDEGNLDYNHYTILKRNINGDMKYIVVPTSRINIDYMGI